MSVDSVMKQVNKEIGPGAVMRMSDAALDIETVSTGILSLDHALGAGGLPRGRVVEIYGHESSGKTTIALSAVKAAMDGGGEAAFIDAEHALDPRYAAEVMGVDVNWSMHPLRSPGRY